MERLSDRTCSKCPTLILPLDYATGVRECYPCQVFGNPSQIEPHPLDNLKGSSL